MSQLFSVLCGIVMGLGGADAVLERTEEVVQGIPDGGCDPPPQPTNPDPQDGETNVPVDTNLAWNGAAAEVVTLDAVHRGWWKETGYHDSANNNTFTGYHNSGLYYNSYFIFDVSALDTASSATLRLEIENYYGPDASESLTVYDVSTPAAQLEASGTGRVDIFEDLQSGNAYATFTVTPDDVGNVLEIPLNAQGVADVTAASDFFSVGLHVVTIISPSGNEAVRFSRLSESRVHQLVLEEGPPPCPTTYDVYFGTDPGALELICEDISETTCDPGLLEEDTPYFWQVCAKNPDHEVCGLVWSFTTEGFGCDPPPAPTDPDPADGATDVPIDADLAWNGGGADSCVVVPNANAAVEGDSANAWPFSIGSFRPSMRYQQIYDSGQFSQSGVITEIRFRPDGSTSSSFAGVNAQVEVYLGYAATTVTAPSSTYADNIGPGYTKVLDGTLTLSSAATGGPPRDFDIVVDVDNLFTYDPAAGSLLLDIKVFNDPSTTYFDAVGLSSLQTATTRIYTAGGGTVNDPTGVIHLDGPASNPYGLVTLFCFGGAMPTSAVGSLARAARPQASQALQIDLATGEAWLVGPAPLQLPPEVSPASHIRNVAILQDRSPSGSTTNEVMRSRKMPELIATMGRAAGSVPQGYSVRDGVYVESGTSPEIRAEAGSVRRVFELPAGTTLIHFDDISAPCAFVQTQRLTSEYAALGVIFEGPGGNDGGAILHECGNFGVSGHSRPNFLAFNDHAHLSDGGVPRGPETMHFAPPVSTVQISAARGHSSGGTVSLHAYDGSNALVDSATITLSFTLTPVAVSGSGIVRVVVSSTSSVFVLDDLAFSSGNGGCPTTYDVYFGTDPGALELICEDISETTCDPGTMDECTTYYWQVCAKNPDHVTCAAPWHFETEDTTPPTITCPADVTVECDESTDPANTGTATATDNCDPDPVISYTDDVTPGVCPQEWVITRTWTATDASGNPASCHPDQIITVVDTTAPEITCPADVTVECDESTDPSNTGTATATDNCDPDPVIIYADEVTPGACPQEWVITRTWTATDACENADSRDQVITVKDTIAPEITCPADVTVECDESTDPSNTGTATATDNCDPDPAIAFSDSVAPAPCPADPNQFVIERAWTATDACGNANSNGQTITVLRLEHSGIIIKQGACPAPLNRNSHGVLPVLLPGDVEFDVGDVDLSTVRLSRVDCVGGSVAPNNGPPGPPVQFKDLSHPYTGAGPCSCNVNQNSDGITDLSMKFRTDDLVDALELDDLLPGELVELVLSGTLADGCEFIAFDCVRIVSQGSSPALLIVQSNAPGAWLDVTPLDDTLDGGGFADFERTYPGGSVVTLTASPTHSGLVLAGWELDGARVGEGLTLTITLPADEIVPEAVYVPVSRLPAPAPTPRPTPRPAPRPVIR